MSRSEEQQRFLIDLAKFLVYCLDYCGKNGITVTGGELWRPPLQAWVNSMPPHSIASVRTPDGKTYTYTDAVGGVGILKSKHLERLAIDLNFIKDGQLFEDFEQLKPLGEYWQSLSPENRAGMFFSKPDMPHFERNA
jgi:hypothetical protein